jgi:hypothetical protein
MASPALFRRNAAAAALVGSAVLAAASTFLYQPSGGGRPAQVLSDLHDAGTRAQVATVLFVLFQLAAMVAALGIGHLLRDRFPRLSGIGAGVAAVGAFADAVASTFTLAFVPMAEDASRRGEFTAIVTSADKVQNLFSLVGLLGTVVGTLLLSIGLFRAAVGPRWAPVLLWAFLVLEFVGSAVSPVLGLAAVALALIAYCGLAMTVARTPASAWETGTRTDPAVPVAATA